MWEALRLAGVLYAGYRIGGILSKVVLAGYVHLITAEKHLVLHQSTPDRQHTLYRCFTNPLRFFFHFGE